MNYLCHTRPNIALPVGVVFRFMHNPSKLHLGAAKWILKYVTRTVEFGIWYSKESDGVLVGFSDSDWAGSIDDRKSTSSFVFNLSSGVVSWCSKKPELVALSTLK